MELKDRGSRCQCWESDLKLGLELELELLQFPAQEEVQALRGLLTL